MDVTAITQIISTVGFPIAMCLLLAWYVREQQKVHQEEVKELSNAVSNNTIVLQRLVDLLDKDN